MGNKRDALRKKLDALLKRNFETYKFKPQVTLAISRLAVFKNQRKVKASQAKSDVLQLLQQGHNERALFRVEHVIKEQNMLDAFVMMEGYCNLLIERLHLIEQERVCPDELKEAITTLLFAASRCGEFPELQEIRALFTSWYGKEFVGRAIELRNNCGVSPKMIQKLSTRPPDLEIRMKVIKEIAAENHIDLQVDEASSISTEENLNVNKKQKQDELEPFAISAPGNSPSRSSGIEMGKDDGSSNSFKTRKKYKDVADAAQAAFESAAYAAEAARAAVELSRSESHDPDDQNSPSNRQRKATNEEKQPVNLEYQSQNKGIRGEIRAEELRKNKNAAELESVMSDSSSDSTEGNLKLTTMYFDEVDPVKLLEKDVVIFESDSEDSGSFRNQTSSSSKAGADLKEETAQPAAHAAKGPGFQSIQHSDVVKGPISVRTRGVRGY